MQKVIEEIGRRIKDNEEPLSASRVPEVLALNRRLADIAIRRALEDGLLVKVKNTGKSGYHLEPPQDPPF
jgi:hypothetical protein